MIVVGIDNGLNGGMVALNDKEEFIFNIIMPTQKVNGKLEYDVSEIVSYFSIIKNKQKLGQENVLVILEKAHVRPISGKRACFMTGYGYGLIRGILGSMYLPYEIVTPQTWMKELGINSKDKKGSVMFCKQRFPNEDWTATKKSKNIHDGKTDACGLALYGLRRYNNV